MVLFAVPAEEFIDVEERLKRRDKGEIEFLLGKPELVAKGHFDDIDMAMMIHAGSHDQMRKRSFIADSSNVLPIPPLNCPETTVTCSSVGWVCGGIL